MVDKKKSYVKDRWEEWHEFIQDALNRVQTYLKDPDLSDEDLNRKCGKELKFIGYNSRNMTQFSYRVRKQGTTEGRIMDELASGRDIE